MSGKRAKKERKEIRKALKLCDDPRSAYAFPVGAVKQEVSPQAVAPQEPVLSPEEKELVKLYKTFATTVWRMRNIVFTNVDEPGQEPEPREELNERSVAKLARYIESIYGALEDAHVTIKGDYVGTQYDENDAVKVVSTTYPEGQKKSEYTEVLTPTVRWKDKDGKVRLLQQAEVVVAKPVENN